MTEAEHEQMQERVNDWARVHSFEPFPEDIAEWQRSLRGRIDAICQMASDAHPGFTATPIDQDYGKRFIYFVDGTSKTRHAGLFDVPWTMPIEDIKKRIRHHRPSEYVGDNGKVGLVPTTCYGASWMS